MTRAAGLAGFLAPPSELRNMRYAECVIVENPFQCGNVVQAESFCNRKQELADLTRAMENGERLFVYSERRFGKTSLVLLALQKLPKTQFVGVYVDLWPTDDLNSFATAMAKAIAEATATTAGKMMERCS